MKIMFRALENKIDKSGLCPVFLDCSYSGKRLRYFTGEKCEVKDWDSKKMRFRRSFDGWLSANDLLDSLESRLLSSFRLFRAKNYVTHYGLKRCPKSQRPL
jgi:integrase/recombinase XerD